MRVRRTMKMILEYMRDLDHSSSDLFVVDTTSVFIIHNNKR